MRFVLLGSNISHSLSPAVHNYLFERHGLPHRYALMPLDAEELPAALERMKREGYRGANVTSPHKEALFNLLDERSETAERIGAVNTIVFDDGRAIGFNTDTDGFRWSLRDETLVAEPFTAAVLGTGGAARAAIDVLLEFDTLRGLQLVSRSVERAAAACRRWTDPRLSAASLEGREPADMIVHGTPVGLAGREGRLLEPDELAGTKLLYEMIYRPVVTSLMEAAAEAGVRTIGGRDMFVGQALAAFRLWTGIAVDPDELPADLV